jgi:CheY-like chemotaxis protein
MLVDDDLFNREMIGSIISMSGADVVTVESGFGALRLLEADRAFDVVFLDVRHQWLRNR